MIPGTHNITIYQGETWVETWTRSGVTSASGWSATIDIRQARDSASTRYLQLTSSSGIVLSSDGTNLVMAITITDDQSAALTFTSPAVYDLKLGRPDGTTEYLLTGEVSLRKRVTL